MVSRILRTVGAAVIAMSATQINAQEVSDNLVANHTAWSVHEGKDPRECWAVAVPGETVNTKDGRVVAVRRSQILLMAFFRPSASNAGQVTFTGGYPFAGGSNVQLDVDGTKFNLFTEGEWAWPTSTDEDAKIIAALKRGKSAVLTARSARGTTTKDTFSLLGFTAAVEDASKRCR